MTRPPFEIHNVVYLLLLNAVALTTSGIFMTLISHVEHIVCWLGCSQSLKHRVCVYVVQSRLTLAFCTSPSSPCVVCWVLPRGKFSTSDDTSRPRNLLNSYSLLLLSDGCASKVSYVALYLDISRILFGRGQHLVTCLYSRVLCCWKSRKRWISECARMDKNLMRCKISVWAKPEVFEVVYENTWKHRIWIWIIGYEQLESISAKWLIFHLHRNCNTELEKYKWDYVRFGWVKLTAKGGEREMWVDVDVTDVCNLFCAWEECIFEARVTILPSLRRSHWVSRRAFGFEKFQQTRNA